MRVVMGLSLTSSSAVWVLVDTYDGKILADEVVPLESVNEVARPTARSVQSFALQSDHEIDGVRLVWDAADSTARQQGIRLRTKLRLFGFDTVETVTEDAAREGRNRTARHIAPHLVLAYGAARADLDEADARNMLRRLAARVPLRVPSAIPVRLAAAASVAALAVVALALYAFSGGPVSQELPDTAAAEVVGIPAAPAAPAPAPQAIPAPQPAAAQAVTVMEPAVTDEAPAMAQMPEYASTPTVVGAESVESDVTAVATVVDGPVDGLADAPADAAVTVDAVDPATPEQLSTLIGAPHLTGAGPIAGPVQPVAAPAQATPATAPSAPPASPGPLGVLFRALP